MSHPPAGITRPPGKTTRPPGPEKVNLMDLSLPELETLFQGLGEKPYRAAQVMEWIHQRGAVTFDEMTNLPKALRDRLAAVADPGWPEEVTRQVSRRDGTTKFLFRLRDGETVESVLMVHDYGASVCVSTQVGCRMGCVFCASTIGGMARNLTSGEILGQLLYINRKIRDNQSRGTGKDAPDETDFRAAGKALAGEKALASGKAPAGAKALAGEKGRVSSVVTMGSGEPLENYEQALKFVRSLNEKHGLNIGYRHVTVSTCGVIPGIRRLAAEGLPITLSVSLHAPNDALRSRIMPVNRKYPVAELVEACRDYAEATGRRVTFEYLMIAGLNDSVELARELGRLIRGMLCHVNLIPANPVPERGWKRSSPARVSAFQKALENLGIEATVRREMGADIDAACGQLRRRSLETKNP